MFNTAVRILQNTYDAEDVMQEAFLNAFTKLESFKGEVPFGAWLKRIVINKSLTHIKKKNKLQEVNLEVVDRKLESDDDQDQQESPQIESNLIIDREKIQAAFDEHLNGQGSSVAKTPASAGRGQPDPMISRASVAHSGGPQTDGIDASPVPMIMNPRDPQLTTYLDSEIGTPAGNRSD